MAKKSKKPLLSQQKRLSGLQLLVFGLVFALVGGLVSWAAFAAPPEGKGGGKGKPGSGSHTITGPEMVKDQNGDGLPNHGDIITFQVDSSATKPTVVLNCYQNDKWVVTGSAGFYPEYPWEPNFTLSGGGWTSGAADCIANLVDSAQKRSKVLTSLSFQVGA